MRFSVSCKSSESALACVLIMKKNKTIKTAYVFSVMALLAGCTHAPVLDKIDILPDQGPVRIELKPEVGYKDITDYKSRTITKKFEKGEITNKISEAVDFTVETHVKQFDAKKNQGTFLLTTIEKDGKVDLSDFAMPELGESLELVLSSTGQVVRAGEIPPGTIYYIPPVSLPKGQVKVGDSWPLTAEWIGSKNGIPLRMEVISILKNIRNCGEAGHCAEVELSGDVSLLGSMASNISPAPIDGKDVRLRFKSEIKGRLLISIASGTVLYSIVKSEEYLNGVTDSVQISTCMTSSVRFPEKQKVIKKGSVDCDPNKDIPAI